uniref:Acetyltransferase n=1 Tax=Heterorhabditis bacteriophora TaxID=37862 RepID=A0A1I7W904_HETBA
MKIERKRVKDYLGNTMVENTLLTDTASRPVYTEIFEEKHLVFPTLPSN